MMTRLFRVALVLWMILALAISLMRQQSHAN